MIKPEVLDAMVAAGCTAEQIAAAVKADQASSSGAARQARYRARKTSQCDGSDVTGVTVTPPPSLDKENTPTPPKETNLSPKEKTPKGVQKKGSEASPRQELETVLDADRADAVLEHRRKLRKPLTAHAAKLLAGKFAQASDPNAAADLMVERGWQGFEPGWGGIPETSSKPKVASIKPDADMSQEELRPVWQKRLNYGRTYRKWPEFWGPMPGQPGCTAPTDMLEPKDGQHPDGSPWDIQRVDAA